MIPEVMPVEPVQAQVQESFAVDTKEKAAWAVRKLAKIRQKQAENNKIADGQIGLLKVEIDQVKVWLAEENGKLEEDALYFEQALNIYHRQVLADDPKAKTIKLPHGQLKIRAQQPEIKREENVIKEWVKTNRPEFLIAQEPKLDWSGLKKAAQVVGTLMIDPDSGEVIPGVEVVEAEDKFSVEVVL